MLRHQNKAWSDIIDHPLPGRKNKPRQTGITMIIDKGLGIMQTRDLLDLAANYIDLIKLGFGTSAFYPPELLEKKLELVKAYNVAVCPGGTFLEVAVLQNRVDAYLARVKKLGFTHVEISDGTVSISDELRAKLIQKALAADLQVITEVGKKDPRETLPKLKMFRQIESDLRHGAFKVILEGRESGINIGIYDGRGQVKRDELDQFLAGIDDPTKIIWEAPLKNQQEELILLFGPNVNLGNIQPADILSLEALRVGLRGDTLKLSLADNKYMESSLPGG